jgi:hypothetical protein
VVTSLVDITRSCSVTIILILPLADTEYVPIVQFNSDPVTDTFASPKVVSSPKDKVNSCPSTSTIVFKSITTDSTEDVKGMPVTSILALAFVVTLSIVALS